MTQGKNVVLITWVSASSKTTLLNELMKRGWKRPLNFTTRKPRTEDAREIDEEGDYFSKELDEYVFINKATFLKKLWNGDFLENVNYWGNFYWVSSNMPEGNVCIILDPAGRAQATAYLKLRGYNVTTVYIDIWRETQAQRLLNRGDSDEEMWKRKQDFEWFMPTPKCIRLNGVMDSSVLADIIERSQWA